MLKIPLTPATEVLEAAGITLQRSFRKPQRAAHITPAGNEVGDRKTGFVAAAQIQPDKVRLLSEEEDWCRGVLDALDVAVFICDVSEGAILDANRRALEMFAVRFEDALKMRLADFSDGAPPYSPAQAAAHMHAARLLGTQRFEWLAKRATGERFWSEVSISESAIAERQRLIVTYRDTTERRILEEKQRQAEEKFRCIFNLSPDSILLTRISDGVIIDCNHTFVKEMAVAYDRIVNHTTAQLGIWRDAREREAYMRELREQGEVIGKEQTVIRPDGQARRVLFSSRIIKIGTERVLLNLGRNITAMEEARTVLEQKNRALRLLYQCNSAVVNAGDEQELLHEICRIAVDLAGYPFAWIGRAEDDEKKTVRPITYAGPGREFLDGLFVSWADNEYGRGTAGTAIRTREPVVGRDLLNNPNFTVWKETFMVRNYTAALAVPLIVDNKVFGAVFIYATEPNAFDATEIELFEELSRNISHGISSLRASHERAEALAALERARNQLEQRVAERTRELSDKNKELVAEIERRISIETSLRESELRFRAVFEQAAVGVAVMDSKTGRYLQVNQRYCEISGYSEEELLRRTFISITYPDDLAIDLENLCFLLAGKVEKLTREKRLVRKDGRIVWVLLSVSPIQAPGVKTRSHISVIEDVTNMKSAEDTLKASEEKYRELVENANSIILRMDTNGNLKFLNEFGLEFFGFSADEVVGHPVVGTIVPATESGGRDLEKMIREIALFPGRYVKNENENLRKNGDRVWISWTNKPLFDAQGRHRETLCIGNDITNLKRAEAELMRAKEAAESADRLKSAFLASMSHELRTPLNSIIGFTGIMLQGLAGPLNDEQNKQLGMVNGSAHHLLSLINDVLDLSKIEAGQLEVRHEKFDLQTSIRRVAESIMPLAAKKKLAVRLRISPDVGMISSDQRRVEQVLMNLLSNAIKFTERGEITVSCLLETNAAEVSVRDTGIGIRPEQQKELFRPFHQLESGLTRRHEGTGLGLSICKHLLELMGGSISFSSEFGIGSVFSFSLPLNENATQSQSEAH